MQTLDSDGGGDLEPLAEINVTPLVDVMLVLLIIFMVTAPMLQAGIKVDLPQAKAAQPAEAKQPVILTIGADGKVRVGADEIARADIVATIRRMTADQNQVVHIRGDRTASYGDVVTVLDDLALNGITRLSLIANRSGQAPRPGESRESDP